MSVPHGSPSDRSDDGNPRRSQRQNVPDERSLTSSIGNIMVVIPFTMLMHVFQILFQSFVSIFGNRNELFSNLFVLNREQNEVLREMPAQQERQQHEIQLIHEVQIHQKDRVADLQRRVDLLDAKRRQRELDAVAMNK